MYLETILLLKKEKGEVRSIDIAIHTGYSKPSISRAMGILRKAGYITVDEGGFIELTESGRAVAASIYERHTMLTCFLLHLGISKETAAADACKMEHYISEETFEKIKAYAERGYRNPSES